jgi:alginate O-acetyltransferase complex protein AlgI
MVFSSLVFICIFLPVAFIAHSLIPNMRVRNVLLVIASLLFYSYGEPVYVLLIIASTLLNYLFGRALGSTPDRASGRTSSRALNHTPSRVADSASANALTNTPANASHSASHSTPGTKNRKLILILAVAANLGMLGVFKYASMVATTGAALAANLGIALQDSPLVDIVLPIGISFYTFQALSYVIDVYRGEVTAQKNYLNILLYISFFPQLIAGPIIKYHDIAVQLKSRTVSPTKAAQGLRRFCVGLAKKVLIANTMAVAVDALFSAADAHVNAAVAWLAALAYLLQIYYDFSGYSDMAIGMGKMFGFDFKENFNYPYRSTSIKEFWRRWHISLSTWFKEYLYIPLGGNRKGRARTSANKIIVFFCTGLWHGANWTFVVWGLFHGLFLLLEDFVPLRRLPRALGHIYALLVVCVGFVLFRAADFGQAAHFISQMFTGFWTTHEAAALALSQLNPLFICAFVAGVLGSFGLPALLRRLYVRVSPGARGTVVRPALYAGSLLLLLVCLMFLSSGQYNPFIYFRF